MAEVEVDTETGEIQVLNYWASHDVGRMINPMLLEGQVQGGVSMGIGWALTEDMITQGGRIINHTLLDYRIPGSKDMPRVATHFAEPVDPSGPFGAKGIKEPALNPVAAAVANAVYDPIGIRFNELPMSAEKVLAALKERGRDHGDPTEVTPRGPSVETTGEIEADG